LSISSHQWEKASRETLSILSKTAGNVFLFNDTPNPGFNIPNCASRAAWQEEDLDSCKFPRKNPKQLAVDEIEIRLANEFTNVMPVNVFDLICSSALCSPIAQGPNILKYRDRHHLTVDYSKYLAKDVMELINSHLIE
jgi:hypothetical protein